LGATLAPAWEDTTGMPRDTTGLPPGRVSSGFSSSDAEVTGCEAGPVPGADEPTLAPRPRTSPGGSGPLAIGQAFGPRYHIIRLLGLGGMGAVYQAWDAELDVVVALKVILPEATGDPEEARALERRFKQELVLARQVTHKNVVRIHDLGEIDGIKYITMSYIEGSDLATVLKTNGKLPVPEALRIMRQVASGLLAAHEAGVVHRDLKPANIMVERDDAIIMDFGIARSSGGRQAGASGQNAAAVPRRLQHTVDATLAGTIVGTVAYMAPEQAKGEAVDQRADIYALGLIMSDMLLGPRPRAGSTETSFEDLQRRMQAPPPPLRSINPEIPEAIDRIVSRSVQPDPTSRFQTTAELVAELDRLDANGVPLPRVRRLTPRLMAAAAVLVIALLGGTYQLTRRAVEPVVEPDPVSVVIADVQNLTGDPAFDGTLEPMLQRALEGAGFITAYDRNSIRRATGVQPPEQLDEAGARGLAVNQGLGVVVAGSLEPQGSGYRISLRATQAVTGNVITTAEARASGKDQVLDVATRLITRVRSALGDRASESDQMFAMASLSTTSLEVVRHFAMAREAASNNRFDDALRSYSQTVALDPKFGLGYQGMANVSANMANQQDADKYMREALRYVSGMTERERLTTRGGFFRVTGDYQQCVKEYSDLIASYPADVAARNNLAICLANLRNFSAAMDEVQQVVAILPNRALYRVNLASYANFSSEFETAEREARRIETPDVNALMALAFAQLGLGQMPQAMETYQQVAAVNDFGASLAASGLADLANLEGRFSDAARILEQGAAEDLMSGQPDWAAAKFAALARTEILRGQPRAAIAAGQKALANDNGLNVRFMVARAFVEAGAADRARPLIASMASELLAEPQAYAKIVESEIALKEGDPRQAIELLTEANALLDTWLGHFDLGRAYFDAEQFTQADAEFERCLRRRGEALQLILGDEPTYAFVPPVYYLQGRVREGMNSEGTSDSYREYLRFRGQSTEDPLVAEVRARVGG
jgi:tetratricopeptide (TPR) repeat protein